MNGRVCDSCGSYGARTVKIDAFIGTRWGFWQLCVCQDCWRAFEAMLGLPVKGDGPGMGEKFPHPGFLW